MKNRVKSILIITFCLLLVFVAFNISIPSLSADVLYKHNDVIEQHEEYPKDMGQHKEYPKDMGNIFTDYLQSADHYIVLDHSTGTKYLFYSLKAYVLQEEGCNLLERIINSLFHNDPIHSNSQVYDTLIEKRDINYLMTNVLADYVHEYDGITPCFTIIGLSDVMFKDDISCLEDISMSEVVSYNEIYRVYVYNDGWYISVCNEPIFFQNTGSQILISVISAWNTDSPKGAIITRMN